MSSETIHVESHGEQTISVPIGLYHEQGTPTLIHFLSIYLKNWIIYVGTSKYVADIYDYRTDHTYSVFSKTNLKSYDEQTTSVISDLNHEQGTYLFILIFSCVKNV